MNIKKRNSRKRILWYGKNKIFQNTIRKLVQEKEHIKWYVT